jgi:hypothetical protein
VSISGKQKHPARAHRMIFILSGNVARIRNRESAQSTLEHLQMQSASSQLGRTVTPPKIEDGKTSVNFSAVARRCRDAKEAHLRPLFDPDGAISGLHIRSDSERAE